MAQRHDRDHASGMRRVLLLLLSCVLFAGCGTSRWGAVASGPHVLRIADIAEPSSLNPLLAHDQTTIGYDLLICQTLVGLDAQNRLVPILLTRIPTRANGDISADGTRITYHLRHDVRFADGKPLTSADVAFTYRAIMDPRNPVLSEDAYRRIVSLQTPDPFTVVIRLRRPWNAAVSELFAQSDFAFGILPAHAFKGSLLLHADWENHAFGSGPFHVTEWRRSDRIVLEPNPYFSPKPKLSRLEIQMIPDANSAFVALRTHTVDVAPLYPDMLALARQAPGVRIVPTPENATVWMTIQLLRPPTNSIDVRRAIAYALDLHTIAQAYRGVYPQAASFLPPVLQPWFDASIPAYPHDLAKARAVLDGKSMDALMVVQSGNIDIRTATIIQEQLARAGMHVSIKQFPPTLYNAPEGPVRNARFTLTIDGWLGGADPEQSIIFLCSQATVDGDNNGRYCNPEFERLFADQHSTRSARRRKQDFYAMQRLIHDQLPIIPLYYEIYFDGVSNTVKGFARNMLRYPASPETWDND